MHHRLDNQWVCPTPHWKQTPPPVDRPGGVCPTPLDADPPPIHVGYYRLRSTSRQYASYWNALFCIFLLIVSGTQCNSSQWFLVQSPLVVSECCSNGTSKQDPVQ